MAESRLPRVELADGYSVPRVIVGAWQLAEGHSQQALDRYAVFAAWSKMLESGLTTFDCADIYTGVEELLGEFQGLFAHQPDADRRIRVHTKFVPDRDVLRRVDRAYVEKIIDRSRHRLGVERIDLVQFYWWSADVPGCVDTALRLTELRSEGKIRNIGVTNFDVPRLRELLDAGVPVVSNQVQYSVLDHRPEHGMAALCRDHDIALLCYGTVAGGFLSETWLGRPQPRGEMANRSLTKYRLIVDELGGWEVYQELLKALAAVARKHGVATSSVAIRYVLDRPAVAAAIVGARNAEHLDTTLAALALRLDDEDLGKIEVALADCRGPAGDIYELERDPDGPHAPIMRYNLNG